MASSILFAAALLAAPALAAPVQLNVSAGPDKAVAQGEVVDLHGAIHNNVLPLDQLDISWEKVGGPGEVSFTAPDAQDTQVTFDTPGDYVLRFSVTEGGFTDRDTARFNVSPLTGTVLTLDPTDRGQLISGWEATANVEFTDSPGYQRFQSKLFNMAVNQLGINRVRLEVRSGAENPVDWYAKFRRGLIPYSVWRERRYSTINDNDDPDSIDWSGFQFTELDETVERIVLPLRQRLAAQGKRLYVNLCYVSFTAQNYPGSTFIHTDPEEYAELAQATMQHLQTKYGIVPDSWELSLEPDNVDDWNGTNLGQALRSTGLRLAADGYHPKFVGPSTTNMANASLYFDEMIQVPGALAFLREISYHRYGGVSTASLQEIVNRAEQYGMQTSHLEHISASYLTLHEDLKVGRNSAWSQYALATRVPNPDNGSAYFIIDDSDPAAPTIQMGAQTRYLRQYFHYITPGSQRIGAETTDDAFDPLAFHDAAGRTLIVVEADHAGSFQVLGLPAGTYGTSYTTPDETHVQLDPIDVIAGSVQTFSIPKRGVYTIYPL